MHNVSAFTDGASPLIFVSGMRMSVDSLGTLSPRMVRKFSVLGSTATATLCKTHNTGNIVLVAAEGNGSVRGTQVGVHIRGSFARPAGAMGMTSNMSCVVTEGGTMLGHAPSTRPCCSRRIVSKAHGRLGPCVCPGMS